MGFLDFLKKKEKQTTRDAQRAVSKQANQALEFNKSSSTNNIPPPPGGSEQATTQDPFASDLGSDPFAQTNYDDSNNPFGQGQSSNEPFSQTTEDETSQPAPQDPFVQTNNNSSSNDDFEGFSPEEPDSFMDRKTEDFGPTQDYDWSHADVLEEPTEQSPLVQQSEPAEQVPQAAVQPEEQEPVAQEDVDFSLPELPELPEEAQEGSVGVHLGDEQEEQHEAVVSDELEKKFAAPTNKQEPSHKEDAAPSAHEKNLDLDDESLKDKPTYDQEEQKRLTPHTFYVETHEFYDTLQEIKALKKTTKECDKNTYDWEEADSKTNKKVDSLIESVDQIQEDLMKIDANLFER